MRRRLAVGPRLNWPLIVPIVCGALAACGIGMLACFAVALYNGDGAASAFGATGVIAVVCAVAGLVGSTRLNPETLRPRDGFLAVTLAWLVAAIIGSIPFLVYGTFADPVDAVFESMSGFTTTGATLLSSTEDQPHAILLWRSLSQWFGGIGIVVIVVALAPAAGMASQRVFYAETSGLPQDRLTPRIVDTAKIIAGLYAALTVACYVAYMIAGMGSWDAFNHALSTLSTGGFSTRTASLGAFDSLPIELVCMTFMAIAGVNFAFYWRAIRGKPLRPQLAEVRVYLLILAGATVVLTVSLLASNGLNMGIGQALREGSFAATSIGTGTGFATTDFGAWSDFARLTLLGLMFIGGCAGSTTGGLKVIRVMLLARISYQELTRQLAPNTVQVLRADSRVFSDEVRRGILGFFLLYMVVFFAGSLALAAFGLDTLTALSASASTLNVVGPGLGDIGALDTYQSVPGGGLAVLSLLMLIGRLEVFTVVVLFTRAFWRRTIA